MVFLTLKDEDKTRLLIAKTGKSLRSFADEIGISNAYLSQILSGSRNPSPTIGGKIAKGLNKEIEEIFLFNLSVDGGQAGKAIK